MGTLHELRPSTPRSAEDEALKRRVEDIRLRIEELPPHVTDEQLASIIKSAACRSMDGPMAAIDLAIAKIVVRPLIGGDDPFPEM